MRAERGGFLQFHASPGDIVEAGQALATNTTLLGRDRSTLYAPFAAVVLGMTTLPAVSPGEAVCHLGKLPAGMDAVELRDRRSADEGLGERVSEELASNMLVVEAKPRPTADDE